MLREVCLFKLTELGITREELKGIDEEDIKMIMWIYENGSDVWLYNNPDDFTAKTGKSLQDTIKAYDENPAEDNFTIILNTSRVLSVF